MPARRVEGVRFTPFPFSFLRLPDTLGSAPAGTYVHVEELCEALNEWGAFRIADHLHQIIRAQADTSRVEI